MAKTKTSPAMSEPTIASAISEPEKVRAAINAPADHFKLGDREFHIKDLPYDDYLAFVSYLSPIIDFVAKQKTSSAPVSLPGIELTGTGALGSFSANSILLHCGTTLVDMALIVCRQTDPEITKEEIKRLAGRPTTLANLVMVQIHQNGIVRDFMDFFGQMTKMLLPSIQ